jgi:DNA processing protein
MARLPREMTEEEFKLLLHDRFDVPGFISRQWFSFSVAELDWIQQNKAQVVTFFDDGYPAHLRLLEDPPQILTWWGELNHNFSDSLSVVGSRHAAKGTMLWMEQHLDRFFSQVPVVCVSGGARGVDQKAHLLAIRNKRPTICVLPSGLNHIYPSGLNQWKSLILDGGGAIVSPFSPFDHMQKRFFIERNRYIAGWSKLTFVLEAKRRSGTMLTARWAQQFGRDLAVLPSAPTDCGMGGLDLIVDGAYPIRDQYDLLQAYQLARIKSWPICAANGLLQ